ncbi:MAG TPA: LLM class flavin-dependent oxidoreductase [Acetobacteraceae bacterium]|nr:LLM class flavin-dependent oxidoreductase [Acetobacteraceae bacterium]
MDTPLPVTSLSAPPAPDRFPESPLSRAFRQKLMLGLFLPIQAGGWTASRLPRTTSWTFDYNAALTRRAEALGFDLVFGLAQWLPKGGYNEVQNGQALDSFMTVAALAAITSRILLISTVHVLYGPWHPVHFAKFGATLDHISGGRWGANVVTGHRAVEHEMFGSPRTDHDRRYELADEFLSVVKHLWQAEENFSYLGERWRMRDAFITPKPRYGRPILVNATGSEAGIGFAARHSDIVFISSPTGSAFETAIEALPAHVARVKAAARAVGRNVRTLINPLIVCGPTDAEAEMYAEAIVASSEPTGFTAGKFDSDAHAWRGRRQHDGTRERGLGGGNLQIVGSPQRVAESLVRLQAAGIDGVQLSFYDFQPDLAFFGEAVLPLLAEAGLREAARS